MDPFGDNSSKQKQDREKTLIESQSSEDKEKCSIEESVLETIK